MRPVGEVPGACDAPAGVRSAHATMHTAGPANATPCKTFAGLWIWASNIFLWSHAAAPVLNGLQGTESLPEQACGHL